MDSVYCEECQLTFQGINDVKSHICSKITNTKLKKFQCYELDMPAREIQHYNSKEPITNQQLIKSGFESTNTSIEGGVYRNFNDSSLQLSVENIRKLDFSNTRFDNHFRNPELGPPSLQPAADKRCLQTSENNAALISHEYFGDLHDNLPEKVLFYNFPSEFLKSMSSHEFGAKTKPISSHESELDIIPIQEGISLHHEQSQKYNSLSYISDLAFGCSEDYTNVCEQVMPSSEFSFNSFPHQSASNFNLIHDDNGAIQNNLYGSNPCDILLDKWAPSNYSNVDDNFSATDPKISKTAAEVRGFAKNTNVAVNTSLLGRLLAFHIGSLFPYISAS
ncbi:zinc finger protein 98 [Trichonephila clavata]|uniref:Zinc finger protein 98 n=1 Tax=Trichonephila clavata TaxID=2740835 RepID=A0A8X6HBL2_TRICU|nr:zinc finger protein 98 [Trichonephila clavata]